MVASPALARARADICPGKVRPAPALPLARPAGFQLRPAMAETFPKVIRSRDQAGPVWPVRSRKRGSEPRLQDASCAASSGLVHTRAAPDCLIRPAVSVPSRPERGAFNAAPSDPSRSAAIARGGRRRLNPRLFRGSPGRAACDGGSVTSRSFEEFALRMSLDCFALRDRAGCRPVQDLAETEGTHPSRAVPATCKGVD